MTVSARSRLRPTQYMLSAALLVTEARRSTWGSCRGRRDAHDCSAAGAMIQVSLLTPPADMLTSPGSAEVRVRPPSIQLKPPASATRNDRSTE